MWFLYLVLKGFSVSPMYVSEVFHGVSFHLAHPITVQVKGVTFASKRNF